MVTVKIYVEGGGDTDRLRRSCREGFSKFFEHAGLKDAMPRVVACGSRDAAMDRFKTAVAHNPANVVSLLVVDSEDPVIGPCSGATAISFLDSRENKGLAAVAEHHQCHLMVQVMETWFLADPEQLAFYFGQGFKPNSLPTTQLEGRSKQDVLKALKAATGQVGSKGEYGKGAHSFEILARIDATKVLAHCFWAQRLVTTTSELKRGQHISRP